MPMPKPSLPSRHQWLARSAFPRSAGGLLPWLLAALIGTAAGIGAYTFSYAKGLSYFGTDPRACTNCHIMEPQYAGWQKSSHHTVAVCIDCHLPHSFVPKYLAKAENGYRHGKLFTTQTFEEPITIKPKGLEILQSNCERCHAALVEDVLGFAQQPSDDGALGEYTVSTSHAAAGVGRAANVPCIHCHWTVGHGERAGLGGPLRDAELRDTELRDTELFDTGAAPSTEE
jgi:cytochrome c nitrite reductase small subunit